MERIAIISDIHGNMPALEAVLEDINNRGINRVFCLGDLSGKGPSSAEAVDKIREHCEVVIKGNWDYYMTDIHDNEILKWHQNKLGAERIEYLNGLPIYKEFYISGKLLRLCHASPNDLFHRVHLSTIESERIKLFAPTATLDVDADVIGYGDIHGAHIDNFHGKTNDELQMLKNNIKTPEINIEEHLKNNNIEKHALKTTGGIGLKNVYERIRLFLGNDYKIIIYSKVGEYTKVVLNFPIIR